MSYSPQCAVYNTVRNAEHLMGKYLCWSGRALRCCLVLVILTLFMSAVPCALAESMYHNPVLAGDYPDPSIIHVGREYYMVNTSEMYTPGLLIWHSRDLVHWAPVTYALKRYDGIVAAPDLTYYKHRFYIYYTPGRSTHVITAQKIQGPWSNPVRLTRRGKPFAAFDPFFMAGPHGTPYLIGAGDFIVRLSPDGLSVVGKRKYIYKGWPIPQNWIVECPCLEGPKVFRHDGYYYLVSAEGGTSGPPTSHMAILARSQNLLGHGRIPPISHSSTLTAAATHGGPPGMARSCRPRINDGILFFMVIEKTTLQWGGRS